MQWRITTVTYHQNPDIRWDISYKNENNSVCKQHELAVSANLCTLWLQLCFDLLLQYFRLLAKNFPQYLSTWRNWNCIYKFNSTCEVLVGNFVISNVLIQESVRSCKNKETCLYDWISYVCNLSGVFSSAFCSSRSQRHKCHRYFTACSPVNRWATWQREDRLL